MKNTFLTGCFLLVTSIVLSQSSISNEIIGKWKVKKVLKANKSPKAKDVVNGFAGATFTFEKDHSFALITTNKSKLFSMVTNMTNDKSWLIMADSTIAVGSKNNYVMNIRYQAEKNRTTFTISETDILLEVEKSE